MKGQKVYILKRGIVSDGSHTVGVFAEVEDAVAQAQYEMRDVPGRWQDCSGDFPGNSIRYWQSEGRQFFMISTWSIQ